MEGVLKIQPVLAGAFSVAALIFSAAPVQATTTEQFNFADNVDGIFAIGDFTLASSANANGTFDITGIVNGTVIDDRTGTPVIDQISALIPNPGGSNPTIADGFIYDNLAPLNTNGVLFQGDSNAIYNLWSNGGKAGELYTYGLPGVPNFDAHGTLSVGVPEPATWAIMLVGFGGLGGALRGARRKRALAA